MPSKKSRWRKVLFRVLALTLGLLAALIVCELVLRIYLLSRGWTSNAYVPSIQLLVPDETNGYHLAKNYRLKSGAFEITTNQFGLRGPEIESAKPAGTKRIAVIGGSSAFGYLVNDDQVASRLLENNLREQGFDVEVLCGAVPGYNLYQTTARFKRDIAPLQPDVVLLYAGWNDLTYLTSDQPNAEQYRILACPNSRQRFLSHSVFYGFVFYRMLGSPVFAPPAEKQLHLTEAGKQQYRANLVELAQQVHSANARLVVCSQLTAAHPDADSRAQQYVGTDAGHIRQTTEMMSWVRDTLQEFAANNESPFIDAYNDLPATPENLGDAIHLTAPGEQAIANLWTARLENLLPEQGQ